MNNLLENMAFWKGSGVLSNIPLMSDRALSRFQSNLSSSYFPFFIVNRFPICIENILERSHPSEKFELAA